MADKINNIPVQKTDTSNVLRANIDYGTESSNPIKNAKVGDVITLNRHLSSSKDAEGLQNVVSHAASKGYGVKEYYSINGVSEGIDVNKILGTNHTYSNQKELILKKGLKLELVEERKLNNKPFKIFKVVKQGNYFPFAFLATL